MIENSVKINVKGREYEVPYPNVGQFYQIEAMKQSLSRGFYNTMVMSPSTMTQHALDMIDIEASLVVLCPKLIEDLKVKNFSQLDVRDYKLVRDEYVRVVEPFFREINEMLQLPKKEDEKSETE